MKRKLKVPDGLKRAQQELEQATRERRAQQQEPKVESAEDLAFHLNEQGHRTSISIPCPNCGQQIGVTVFGPSAGGGGGGPKALCTPSQLT